MNQLIISIFFLLLIITIIEMKDDVSAPRRTSKSMAASRIGQIGQSSKTDRKKRSPVSGRELIDMDELALTEQYQVLQAAFNELSETSLREICKISVLLESVANGAVSNVATLIPEATMPRPVSMAFDQFHDKICSSINVTEDVKTFVNRIINKVNEPDSSSLFDGE